MADTQHVARERLTRELLARQHLSVRWSGPAIGLVEHLVGLQAQNPSSPYLAAWTRLEGEPGARAAEISAAVADRRLVRVACLRGTVHLVTAADALVLPALTDDVAAASLRGNGTFAREIGSLPLDEVAAAARDLVEESPSTPQELDRALAARWPGRAPGALSRVARGMLHLAQVTPRGEWGASSGTRWTTTRAWLGRDEPDLRDPEARDAALRATVVRYLRAFGPASVLDVQAWSGLRGLRPVVEALRPDLLVRRAPPTPAGRPGRELFDVPDADRPAAADLPAVRLLPDFDNLTLSHADRTRVVDDDVRRSLATPNGVGPGVVLVAGRVAGTWRLHAARGEPPVLRASLLPTGTGTGPRGVPDAVDAEGLRMLALLAPDATADGSARVEVTDAG